MKNDAIVIGRDDEKALFNELLHSDEANFLAIYGRRRVGKTYLINSYFEPQMAFSLTGLKDGELTAQLTNFQKQFSVFFYQSKKQITSWQDAFYLLQNALERRTAKKKYVLFFDELPWLAHVKSGFLQALDYFWNTFGQYQKKLILIVCGSAASWMLDKIVNHKGGLHNRLSNILRIDPFTLTETETFLRHRGVKLERYSILELYMVLGGIPQYLKEVKPGESVAQLVDRLFFAKNGLLRNEYNNLYDALFNNANVHKSILKLLCTRKMGLTRNSIIKSTKLSNGGSLTRILTELTESGFITKYQPYGKQERQTLYRLTDYYTLFYFQYLEGSKALEKTSWQKLYSTASWRTYSGFAFENICMQHIIHIKKALGISGIYSEQSSLIITGKDNKVSAQIDIVLDRNDNVINIIECKFYNNLYSLTAKDAASIRNKIAALQIVKPAKKSVSVVLLSSFGVQPNAASLGVLDQSFDMNCLF